MKRVLLVLSVLALSGCSVVGQQQRGIRYFFGKAQEKEVSPGAYFYFPFFAGMKKIQVNIQETSVHTAAASADIQDANTDISVNWSIIPTRVVQTYTDLGAEEYIEDSIIKQNVAEVLKAATAKRNAEALLKDRIGLKTDVDAMLKERLESFGIKLHAVNIVNFRFSDEYMKAVEAKQVAEQDAKRAVYIKDKATQEGLAEIERARGTAQAQALQKSSITPEYLQKLAIDKWDGHFPQVMGGGTVPFLNIDVKK